MTNPQGGRDTNVVRNWKLATWPSYHDLVYTLRVYQTPCLEAAKSLGYQGRLHVQIAYLAWLGPEGTRGSGLQGWELRP